MLEMDDEFAKFYEEVEKVVPRPESGHTNESYDSNEDEKEKLAVKKDEAIEVKNTVESNSNNKTVSDPTNANPGNNDTVTGSEPSVVKANASEDSKSAHSENITCIDGERIYTNPETKEEFSWNDVMKQWVPRGYNPVFDGTSYRYTDKNGVHFKWNVDNSSWEKSDKGPEQAYGYDGENYTYTDPKDNSVFFWDKEKSAWFPKVDDDFMARYQMSYGFVDNTTKDESADAAATAAEKAMGKRKAPSDPTWFEIDDAHNTKVYVSNLPTDITEQEFIDFMQKCGLVLKDMKTNKYKVKLYKEPDGTLKGDALCDYIKIESVELALSVLDGSNFKGKNVRVQRAKFQMKGAYNPSLKPKKKRKNEKEKEKKLQQKLLDWRPDKLRGEREKHERTVVIKNMFTPALFDENMELILEYTDDIRSEASKCGTVRKVTLYDKNPEGVATVTFSDAEEADICVKFFNNRWFGKRKILAETWDGKTKYKVVESEVENRERLDKWNKFLEQEEMVKQ